MSQITKKKIKIIVEVFCSQRTKKHNELLPQQNGTVALSGKTCKCRLITSFLYSRIYKYQ